MARLPQGPRELHDSWWQSYEKRLDATFDFYSMPLVFFFCCCGCGIPCKDAWNALCEFPAAALRRIHGGAQQSRDHKRHQELIDALAAPQLSPFQRRRKPHDQQQSYLFRLPLKVRLHIWEYCVSDRFIYAPAYRYGRQRMEPRYAEYPSSWPQQAHIRPPVDSNTIPDAFSRFWRPLELIEIHDTSKQELLEPNHLVAFGDVRPASTAEETVNLSRQNSPWTGMALLLTCRAISTEAAPLLLTRNTFSFTHLPHMATFRLHMGPDRWQCLRYLHLDIIVGPSLDIPGVVDRAAWKALWLMVSRELRPVISPQNTGTVERYGLQELDLDVHVPMNHTVERWFVHRDRGWRGRDTFFEGLPDWADDLTMLRGLRRARLAVDAERLAEYRDPSAWPHSSSVILFGKRLINIQHMIASERATEL